MTVDEITDYINKSEEINDKLRKLNEWWEKMNATGLLPHLFCLDTNHTRCDHFHPEYVLGDN